MTLSLRSLLLPIALFISWHTATAQKLAAGPQVLSFYSDVDDTEQPYALYLPKNFDEHKKYPLVVMLHGAGSNHRLALKRVFGKSNTPGETDVEASRYFPSWKDVDYIVVAPYARGTLGYQGFREKDVWDMLADVQRRFSIDEDRMYLTGLSMGGGGTLWLGLSRPDLWAAIAPVCPAPPPGTDALAPNALNFPVHFFQGDADQAVPVEGTRKWVKNLQDLGTKVEYTEYPGVNHNSWENAYENGFIFDWFGQFKRNPHPERVRFVSNNYRHRKAWWIQFDQLTPGEAASIDAKFTKANNIEVSTSGLRAFTLDLTGHPTYDAYRRLKITIDGQTLNVSATNGRYSFNLQDKAWTFATFVFPENTKQPGAEGPLAEAFAERHLYVYGTLDNPSPEELNKRIEVANAAANWSIDRGQFLGRVRFYPRVIADKEVRPSDLESSHLILFGDKTTNQLIAKSSEQLPIELNSSATDYCLLYIYPHNGHYVVINSGPPWWTGLESKGWRYLPEPYSVVSSAKDFLLFKDNPQNVILGGTFDNSWKLKPEDAAKLKESGVVLLNR